MLAPRPLSTGVSCSDNMTMNVRHLTVVAYSLLVVAVFVSLFYVRVLKPTSAGSAVFLSIWLLLPYFVLAMALRIKTYPVRAIAGNLLVTFLVVVGGLLFLTDVIFLHPDPQGGIAVLFTPIYQGVATAILFPLSRWALYRGCT